MYKKFLFLISFVMVLSMAYNSYGDAYPPLPNDAGMIWADPPVATSPTTIVMACVDACDVNDMPCWYLFTCTNDATKSSTWQSSTLYEATGLTPKTKYTFNVQAKDNAGTTNDASYNVSATTDDNSTPPVLRLDLNATTDNNDANTQTSFVRFTLPMSGTDINGVIPDFTVSEGGINPARRGDPCGAWNEYELHGLGNGSGDPCYFLGRGGERLYRDFFSGFGSTTNGFTITLWGLGVNQDCNIMMWAYDSGSLKSNDVNRVAIWNANGVHIFDTNFAGGSAGYPRYLDSVGGSNDLYRFAFKGRATADSLGRIALTCTRHPISSVAEPFCFVNALKIEPNMIKSDGSPYTFAATHYAYRPIPASGVAGCVPVNTQLKWHNGQDVVKQDIYLGTNSNDVNTATRTSHLNVLACKLDQPPEANQGTFPITNGSLALDTTYYWKVDENDSATSSTLYRGENWHFATCPNHVIDDFDEYAPPAGPPDMEKVWNDYWYQSPPLTCAEVFPDMNAGTLHLRGTRCSMQYHFENASYDPYYSEARASVDTARPLGLGMDPNWLGMNAKSLSMWFYGKADNNANQPMYVKLTDGDATPHTAQVNYDGDMSDIKVASWHEWDILLTAFTGVNMSNVKTMTVGFGNGTQMSNDGIVWFDDFQIYATRCALSKRDANFAYFDYAPLGSPGGDCVVDYKEIQAMSTVWLNRDLVIETNKPGDSNLVVWYPLDEATDIPAYDGNMVYNHLDTNHPDVCDPSGRLTGTLWNNTIGVDGTPIGPASPPGYYGASFSTPGYNGTGSCIYMDGTQGGRVQCGTTYRNLSLGIGPTPPEVNAITVSAWIKWLGQRTWDAYLDTKGQGIAGKRSGYSESEMIWTFWISADTGPRGALGLGHYSSGDTATPDLTSATGLMNPYIGQWVHVAATFPHRSANPVADANDHAWIYLNGGRVADGPWRFSHGPDPNIYFTIAQTIDQNGWTLSPSSFYGYVDEVRIYNRALDVNEIGYLADLTPSDWLLWVPIPSPSDVMKSPQGEGAVNFKDFAMVALRWLNEDMYP